MSYEKTRLTQVIENLRKELQIFKTQKFNAEKSYKKTLLRVLESERELDELNQVEKNSVRVTDHAIVRYLERFQNMDIDVISKKITDKIDLNELEDRNGSTIFYYPEDNMKVVIDNYTVITVTELK